MNALPNPFEDFASCGLTDLSDALVEASRFVLDEEALLADIERNPRHDFEEAMMNFYSAERRAGACPLVANERMAEFAKRLDDLQYHADLNVIKQCMERT